MQYKRRTESGAAHVEFTIAAMVFFVSCFLIIDILRLAYAYVTTQYVVDRTMREITVTEIGAGAFNDRLEYVKENLLVRADSLALDRDEVEVLVCSLGNVLSVDSAPSCDWGTAGAANSGENAGEGSELVSIAVRYNFSWLWWLVDTKIDAVAIGRNEPFA